MNVRQSLLILGITVFCAIKINYGQAQDFSGTYRYEVRNTPYGNYFGKIFLKKDSSGYKGEIVNSKGAKYTIKVLRLNGTHIILATNLEDTDSILSGYFKEDSLIARVEVKGDKFLYKLNAKKE